MCFTFQKDMKSTLSVILLLTILNTVFSMSISMDTTPVKQHVCSMAVNVSLQIVIYPRCAKKVDCQKCLLTAITTPDPDKACDSCCYTPAIKTVDTQYVHPACCPGFCGKLCNKKLHECKNTTLASKSEKAHKGTKGNRTEVVRIGELQTGKHTEGKIAKMVLEENKSDEDDEEEDIYANWTVESYIDDDDDDDEDDDVVADEDEDDDADADDNDDGESDESSIGYDDSLSIGEDE